MQENVKALSFLKAKQLKRLCFYILPFIFILPASQLSAQQLQYRQNLPLTDSLSQAIAKVAQFDSTERSSNNNLAAFDIPHYFIPSYARRNPSGYSYLCRLELQIEDELPLGLWIRADETAHPGGSLYVRMKLIRF